MKKLYYLSFSLFFITTVCVAEISKKEKKALVDLYTSTNGKHWVKKWDLNTPVAQWHGVTIEDNKVVEINLNQLVELSAFNNFLTGEIPNEIGNLKGLKILNLSSNDFYGDIPASLGQLSQLETLGLFENKLEGAIPKDMGMLSNLKELVLANNRLNGEIPNEFAQLVSLEVFQIQNNNFSSFKALEFLETKEYLVFDYDKDDRKLDFKDINFSKTRMADTKFEDIEE